MSDNFPTQLQDEDLQSAKSEQDFQRILKQLMNQIISTSQNCSDSDSQQKQKENSISDFFMKFLQQYGQTFEDSFFKELKNIVITMNELSTKILDKEARNHFPKQLLTDCLSFAIKRQELRKEAIIIFNALSCFARQEGNLQEALNFLAKAEELSLKKPHQIDHPTTFLNQGAILLQMGKYQQALEKLKIAEYRIKALQINQHEQNDKETMTQLVIATYNISIVELYLKHNEESQAYLKQSKKLLLANFDAQHPLNQLLNKREKIKDSSSSTNENLNLNASEQKNQMKNNILSRGTEQKKINSIKNNKINLNRLLNQQLEDYKQQMEIINPPFNSPLFGKNYFEGMISKSESQKQIAMVRIKQYSKLYEQQSQSTTFNHVRSKQSMQMNNNISTKFQQNTPFKYNQEEEAKQYDYKMEDPLLTHSMSNDGSDNPIGDDQYEELQQILQRDGDKELSPRTVMENCQSFKLNQQFSIRNKSLNNIVNNSNKWTSSLFFKGNNKQSLEPSMPIPKQQNLFKNQKNTKVFLEEIKISKEDSQKLKDLYFPSKKSLPILSFTPKNNENSLLPSNNEPQAEGAQKKENKKILIRPLTTSNMFHRLPTSTNNLTNKQTASSPLEPTEENRQQQQQENLKKEPTEENKQQQQQAILKKEKSNINTRPVVQRAIPQQKVENSKSNRSNKSPIASDSNQSSNQLSKEEDKKECENISSEEFNKSLEQRKKLIMESNSSKVFKSQKEPLIQQQQKQNKSSQSQQQEVTTDVVLLQLSLNALNSIIISQMQNSVIKSTPNGTIIKGKLGCFFNKQTYQVILIFQTNEQKQFVKNIVDASDWKKLFGSEEQSSYFRKGIIPQVPPQTQPSTSTLEALLKDNLEVLFKKLKQVVQYDEQKQLLSHQLNNQPLLFTIKTPLNPNGIQTKMTIKNKVECPPSELMLLRENQKLSQQKDENIEVVFYYSTVQIQQYQGILCILLTKSSQQLEYNFKTYDSQLNVSHFVSIEIFINDYGSLENSKEAQIAVQLLSQSLQPLWKIDSENLTYTENNWNLQNKIQIEGEGEKLLKYSLVQQPSKQMSIIKKTEEIIEADLPSKKEQLDEIEEIYESEEEVSQFDQSTQKKQKIKEKNKSKDQNIKNQLPIPKDKQAQATHQKKEKGKEEIEEEVEIKENPSILKVVNYQDDFESISHLNSPQNQSKDNLLNSEVKKDKHDSNIRKQTEKEEINEQINVSKVQENKINHEKQQKENQSSQNDDKSQIESNPKQQSNEQNPRLHEQEQKIKQEQEKVNDQFINSTENNKEQISNHNKVINKIEERQNEVNNHPVQESKLEQKDKEHQNINKAEKSNEIAKNQQIEESKVEQNNTNHAKISQAEKNEEHKNNLPIQESKMEQNNIQLNNVEETNNHKNIVSNTEQNDNQRKIHNKIEDNQYSINNHGEIKESKPEQKEFQQQIDNKSNTEQANSQQHQQQQIHHQSEQINNTEVRKIEGNQTQKIRQESIPPAIKKDKKIHGKDHMNISQENEGDVEYLDLQNYSQNMEGII